MNQLWNARSAWGIDSSVAALLEGEQPLDLVGIVAGKAAGHDFAAAARLDGYVGKEDVATQAGMEPVIFILPPFSPLLLNFFSPRFYNS